MTTHKIASSRSPKSDGTVGGKQRMPIREYYPGEKPYRMIYVEDPFGVAYEIYSHSYGLTHSAGAY